MQVISTCEYNVDPHIKLKKTKNIGHFGWISDKVSTAQSIFDQCPFRFALHRTKGTRIFYRLVDVYSNDLYVHLCIGSNCTDTTIPLQFYVRVDIVLTCGNHLHDRIISSLRVEFEPIKHSGTLCPMQSKTKRTLVKNRLCCRYLIRNSTKMSNVFCLFVCKFNNYLHAWYWSITQYTYIVWKYNTYNN
jgi:hypothetical protein